MPKISEEEVKKLGKKIHKYHEQGNTSSMSEALSALKQQPMTVDILKSTKIGYRLNQLRQSVTDKDVKQQIRNLIKHWKSIADNQPATVQSANTQRASSGDTDRASNGQENIKSSSGKQDKQKQEKQQQQQPEIVKQASDIPLQTTGDAHRDKMRQMLAKHLKNNFSEVFHQRCNECAENLETELYKEYGGNSTKLRTQFMSKLSNLKDPKNPTLRTSFIQNVYSAAEIAKMTPAEMASDELKASVAKLEKENLLDHQVAVNQGTETEMFVCGKCKQKKCTYTQLQTRSSDEPMTTFVYCMNCGNRWKFC